MRRRTGKNRRREKKRRMRKQKGETWEPTAMMAVVADRGCGYRVSISFKKHDYFPPSSYDCRKRNTRHSTPYLINAFQPILVAAPTTWQPSRRWKEKSAHHHRRQQEEKKGDGQDPLLLELICIPPSFGACVHGWLV